MTDQQRVNEASEQCRTILENVYGLEESLSEEAQEAFDRVWGGLYDLSQFTEGE